MCIESTPLGPSQDRGGRAFPSPLFTYAHEAHHPAIFRPQEETFHQIAAFGDLSAQLLAHFVEVAHP
jgi:hypothetical protein